MLEVSYLSGEPRVHLWLLSGLGGSDPLHEPNQPGRRRRGSYHGSERVVESDGMSLQSGAVVVEAKPYPTVTVASICGWNVHVTE